MNDKTETEPMVHFTVM